MDRSEPRNAGVVSEHLVGTANGVQLRRIVYTNPEDGVTYTYLTNDFTLPVRPEPFPACREDFIHELPASHNRPVGEPERAERWTCGFLARGSTTNP